MKIHTVGAELLHADWKDMTKLRVAFIRYVNAPNTLKLALVSASLYDCVLSSC